MSSIVWLDAPDAGKGETGGKGASLIRLTVAGFPVPPGFVVDAEGYRRFVEVNRLQPAIDALLATPDLRVPKVAREACAALDATLAVARLPESLNEEVGTAYARLRERGGAVVAARSSALSEDGVAASSAGLYETYLNLRDREAVLDAVLRCYRSLWSGRAVQYRAFKSLGGRTEAMAVVVMALVPAEVAGVAFTANPITGDRGQIVVNASWGLGESVVSGRVTPDSFVLAKESLAIVGRDVFPKETEIVPDPAGASGIVNRPVESGRAETPALTDAQLRELGTLSLAVEREYDRPMDIEWAFAGDRLYLLQARPITALG